MALRPSRSWQSDPGTRNHVAISPDNDNNETESTSHEVVDASPTPDQEAPRASAPNPCRNWRDLSPGYNVRPGDVEHRKYWPGSHPSVAFYPPWDLGYDPRTPKPRSMTTGVYPPAQLSDAFQRGEYFTLHDLDYNRELFKHWLRTQPPTVDDPYNQYARNVFIGLATWYPIVTSPLWSQAVKTLQEMLAMLFCCTALPKQAAFNLVLLLEDILERQLNVGNRRALIEDEEWLDQFRGMCNLASEAVERRSDRRLLYLVRRIHFVLGDAHGGMPFPQLHYDSELGGA